MSARACPTPLPPRPPPSDLWSFPSPLQVPVGHVEVTQLPCFLGTYRRQSISPQWMWPVRQSRRVAGKLHLRDPLGAAPGDVGGEHSM